MKLALICYHKNVTQYPKQWIDEFSLSILGQTYQDFDIFELNYGGGEERLFACSEFESKELTNHAEAMNYLIDKCFELGYDYMLNTNVDDIYSLDRIEKQLPCMQQGYDIISSNFDLFDERGTFHTHEFHTLNIRKELQANHNIICHPVVAISKHFWSWNRYYPHEIPLEDMKLWQRTVASFKFIILPDVLLHHREHTNSVGHSN